MNQRLRSVRFLTTLLLTTIALTGCLHFSPNANMIFGNGKVIQEDRPLSAAVTGVGTSSPIDLILDPTLTDKVILDGESNILEQVEVNQNDSGVLEIRFKPATSISSLRTVTARVPVPVGGVIQTSSTGSIKATDGTTITGDDLELIISSTGSITLDVDVERLTATGSSTGSFNLTGQAGSARISLSSTGEFNGFDCQLGDANVSVSSTGSARVRVSGNLKGTLSSVGDLIYDGEPADISVSNSSVGKLRKR